MQRILSQFKRLKVRERIMACAVLFILFYIGIDRMVISPFLDSVKMTNEQLNTQKRLLEKYYVFLAKKKYYETRLNDLNQYYEQLREKFLREETEELASAKLQEIINNLALKNGLDVSRSTALKKEIINKNPYLVALSINFEITMLDDTRKLKDFLYDIEYNNDKLLFINNLKVNALGLNVIKRGTVSSTVTAIAAIERKL